MSPDTEAAISSANVKQAVPFLWVTDIESSLHYYLGGLGFTMRRQWIPDVADGNPDGKICWCWLQLGEAAIMLQEFRPENQPKEALGIGISVCFQCEDALAMYRDFKARGVRTRKRSFVGNRLLGRICF